MPQIRQRDALGVLTKPRLLEIAADLGLGLPGRLLKPELVDAIAASPRAPFPRILELLSRNELKAICRAAGIDDSGREKAVIAGRILGREAGDTAPPESGRRGPSSGRKRDRMLAGSNSAPPLLRGRHPLPFRVLPVRPARW